MPRGKYQRSKKEIERLSNQLKPFRLTSEKTKGQQTRLGHKASEETRKKMSETQKKVYALNPERKQKLIGKKHTEEHKRKISLGNKGKTRPCFWKGKKRPEQSGEKSHFWKGGITPINLSIRCSLEYRLWRTSVFERDNYTCIWCNKKGGWNKEEQRQIKLNADHIKPFSVYPELRLAIDNGRTLCVDCHKTTITYGVQAKYYKNK